MSASTILNIATSAEVDSDEEEVFWGPINAKELKASIRVVEQIAHQRTADRRSNERDGKLAITRNSPQEKNSGQSISAVNRDNVSSLDNNGTVETPPVESEKNFISQKSMDVIIDRVPKLNSQNDAFKSHRTPEEIFGKENGITLENSITSQNSFTSSCTSTNSSFMVASESPIQEIMSESFERVDPKKYILKNGSSNRSGFATESPSKVAPKTRTSKLDNPTVKENGIVLNDENCLSESSLGVKSQSKVEKLLAPLSKTDEFKSYDSRKEFGTIFPEEGTESIRANSEGSTECLLTQKNEDKKVSFNPLLNQPFNGQEVELSSSSDSNLTTMPSDATIRKNKPCDATATTEIVPTSETEFTATDGLLQDKNNLKLEDASSDCGRCYFNENGNSNENLPLVLTETCKEIDELKTDLKDLTLKDPLTSSLPALTSSSCFARNINFSQLTEANLSCVSPPNLTVFEDTIASVSQVQLSFSSVPENCPTRDKAVTKELESKKKVFDPKKSNFSSLLRSNSALKTPGNLKTPSSKLASTSERKKKFFSTPPTVVKSTSASKFKFTPANTFNASQKSAEDRTRNVSDSAKRFLSSNIPSTAESKENKSSLLRPMRFGIPQSNGKSVLPAKSSTFRSFLPPPKASNFSRNNSQSTLGDNLSCVKTPTTPAQKLTNSTNGLNKNEGDSCTKPGYFGKPTFKYKGIKSPVARYINDSSSSVSNASFNSSLDSGKLFTDTAPKIMSIPSAKSQSESRLPRFNGPSGIPKVNHCNYVYKSRAL